MKTIKQIVTAENVEVTSYTDADGRFPVIIRDLDTDQLVVKVTFRNQADADTYFAQAIQE